MLSGTINHKKNKFKLTGVGMFGDGNTGQVQDNGVVPPMDPAVMADPQAPIVDHTMTAAYPADDTQLPVDNPVLQMHQEAVAASSAAPEVTMTLEEPMAAPVVSPTHDDDLLAIKQDALTALSPLVGSLEQSAEEKFRTTMMLIQASDDRTLVRQAYEAAQAIEDEKVKAQALLDVVNEINYFTSHTS
jgi:hypothetical protein